MHTIRPHYPVTVLISVVILGGVIRATGGPFSMVWDLKRNFLLPQVEAAPNGACSLANRRWPGF